MATVNQSQNNDVCVAPQALVAKEPGTRARLKIPAYLVRQFDADSAALT